MFKLPPLPKPDCCLIYWRCGITAKRRSFSSCSSLTVCQASRPPVTSGHQNRGAVERRTGHDAEDWDAGWRWLGLDHGLLSVFAYTHVFFLFSCVCLFVRMNLKMRTPVVLRIYRRVWWERCLWGSQAKFSLYWVTSPWMWPWEPPVPSCRSVTLISAVGHPQAIQDVDEFVCSWEQI